jgi:hypothetical protein
VTSLVRPRNSRGDCRVHPRTTLPRGLFVLRHPSRYTSRPAVRPPPKGLAVSRITIADPLRWIPRSRRRRSRRPLGGATLDAHRPPRCWTSSRRDVPRRGSRCAPSVGAGARVGAGCGTLLRSLLGPLLVSLTGLASEADAQRASYLSGRAGGAGVVGRAGPPLRTGVPRFPPPRPLRGSPASGERAGVLLLQAAVASGAPRPVGLRA